MNEYILILISTILVNNFVLVKFLGLCPFMGVNPHIHCYKSQHLNTHQNKLLLIFGGYVAGTSLTGAPLIVAVFIRL
jgi:Na+-translocating ferredoxin:NAD+ oxidoreductase RnfA subunit